MTREWKILTAVLAAALGLLVLSFTVQPAHATSQYEKTKRIVYALFPDSTQDAAMRVVRCETGGTYSPWAYNQSGASGLFQVLTGNAGRTLYYRWPGGKYEKLVIEAYVTRGGRTINRLFNPWFNTKGALFLSKGGTDWSEWVCKP